MSESAPRILQEEIDEFMSVSKNEADDSRRCRQIIGQLRAELAKAKGALRNYGGHRHSCMLMQPHSGVVPCDCGFEQALKGGE